MESVVGKRGRCSLAADLVARKRGRCSSAADLVAGNDDLLVELFVRLPSKSLIRLKLVCKRWNKLISDRWVLDRWRLRQEQCFIFRWQEEFIICDPMSRELSRVRFPRNNFVDIRILQSAHGVLLLKFKTRKKTRYYMWNPTTTECRPIHCIPGCEEQIEMWLLYDPSQSENYKILRIRDTSMGKKGVSVFDSATREWNRFPATHEWNKFPTGLSFNRRVYSIGSQCHSILYGPQCCSRWYSPETKQLLWIPIPSSRESDSEVKIVQSNHCLHCLQLYRKRNSNTNRVEYEWEVYEMVDEQWQLIRFKSSTTFTADADENVRIIGIVRKERIEDSLFLFCVAGRVMVYTFSDQALVHYGSFQFAQTMPSYWNPNIYPFIHTLVSL